MSIACVDCTHEPQLCHDEEVHAFPTLRLYRHGRPVHEGTYRGDRTVVAMAEFFGVQTGTAGGVRALPVRSRTCGETTGMMMTRDAASRATCW